MPDVFKAKSSVFFRTPKVFANLFVAESAQQVKMNRVQGNRQYLYTLNNEHINQCPSGTLAMGTVQTYRWTFQ